MQTTDVKPSYGNWVSLELIRKMTALLLVFGVLDAALWLFLRGLLILKLLPAVLAAFFLIGVIYFIASRRLLSDRGGDVQNKVVSLLISRIGWNGEGKVLDIGCGGGRLAVGLAEKYGRAQITGVDYWGGSWGYRQKQCEENAGAAGVGGRITFVNASASKLPFPDETFDLAVSNLTFHEVRDSKNKLDVLKEALRVVKKGGRFVFQDLFLLKSYYGAPEELVSAVEAMGAKNVRFENTGALPFIPRLLKLPFMLGALGILSGEKL